MMFKGSQQSEYNNINNNNFLIRNCLKSVFQNVFFSHQTQLIHSDNLLFYFHDRCRSPIRHRDTCRWRSHRSQRSSDGQLMPKVSMSPLQSDRTRSHSSLHGRSTRVWSLHSGTKAWHRNRCTSGEQRRLASGMKCCTQEKSEGRYFLDSYSTVFSSNKVIYT